MTEMPRYALEVDNIVKVYPAHRSGLFGPRSTPVRAIDGLSFQVPRGSIFGMLGPNGAGKTTLLKIFATLLQPSSGHARIEGFDVVEQPLEVRRRMSMVLQETAGEVFLSVRDNLLTYARFHGLAKTEAEQRSAEIMQLFDLTTEADRKVQDLSGGYRRRVQVAKVFLVKTPVLFLDEFSTGMDPILKRAVMDELRKEAGRGRTIVLTTQILSEAETLCDDILILNKGRQIARGDLHALKLLSQDVYEVAITFESLPPGIEETIAALHPVRSHINGNTMEFCVKAQEAEALEIVAALARKGRVLRVEIGGASLEDIFVELTQKAAAAGVR
jgi:ABC-2 type transport system ATP-binding protein